MIKPERGTSKNELPRMTAEQRRKYGRVVTEELAAKDDNIVAAQETARRLKAERQAVAKLVATLRYG